MNKYEQKILECEKNGEFDKDIVPINPKHIKPLGKNFTYLPKSIAFKSYSLLIKGFLNIIGPAFTKLAYKIKVEGRNKIKGIKSAIVTTNHVMFTDSLISRVAIKKTKVYFAGGDFNNKKGLAGLTLRAGGFIPLGTSLSEKQKFAEAVKKLLEKKSFIVFFPEGSLWPEYKKPRPFKRGAFYYAYKNNVPLIPIFICFKESKKKKDKYSIIVKILDPITPQTAPDERTAIRKMQEEVEGQYKAMYEDFYGKPLTY